MTTATRLRLYSRPGCHLCDEMAHNLTDLGLTFESVNIEDDPTLRTQYGSLIPVLMQDANEVARAPQSARTLRRALHRAGII